MNDQVNKILEERAKTHGSFYQNSRVSQEFKRILYENSRGGEFSPEMREALDMIFHKLSRIIVGNPYEPDHWDDIAGYATLVAKSIQQEKEIEISEKEYDPGVVYNRKR